MEVGPGMAVAGMVSVIVEGGAEAVAALVSGELHMVSMVASVVLDWSTLSAVEKLDIEISSH